MPSLPILLTWLAWLFGSNPVPERETLVCANANRTDATHDVERQIFPSPISNGF